jgi:hypothetical protein
MSKHPSWIDNIPNPKVLLIVAHPDDETIFAGGLILTSPLTTVWTILCVTEEQELRTQEFECACHQLSKFSGHKIIPVTLRIRPESPSNLGLQQTVDLDNILKGYKSGYDIVLTHNQFGEYGNEHHKAINKIVLEEIAGPIWCFVSPGSTNINPNDVRSQKLSENIEITLPPEILRQKSRIFHECHRTQAEVYGMDPNSYFFKTSDLRTTLEWEFLGGREEYTLKKST